MTKTGSYHQTFQVPKMEQSSPKKTKKHVWIGKTQPQNSLKSGNSGNPPVYRYLNLQPEISNLRNDLRTPQAEEGHPYSTAARLEGQQILGLGVLNDRCGLFFRIPFVWWILTNMTGWWFPTFFIFTPIWENDQFWLIFFRWVETTNYCRWSEMCCLMFFVFFVFLKFGGFSELWFNMYR